MDRRTLIAAGATAVSLPVLRRFGARGGAARPVPSPAQLRWQREETALFVHFGINTFTDREWGDGTESPSLFDPAALDARQWARAARAAGAGSLVLTAKHHEGILPLAHGHHSPFRCLESMEIGRGRRDAGTRERLPGGRARRRRLCSVICRNPRCPAGVRGKLRVWSRRREA